MIKLLLLLSNIGTLFTSCNTAVSEPPKARPTTWQEQLEYVMNKTRTDSDQISLKEYTYHGTIVTKAEIRIIIEEMFAEENTVALNTSVSDYEIVTIGEARQMANERGVKDPYPDIKTHLSVVMPPPSL